MKSSMKKVKDSEKSEMMDPADDSFTVSPMNDVKYGSSAKKTQPADRQTSKQPTGNLTISGVSEFDYLGKEEDSDLAKDENPVKDGDGDGEDGEDENDDTRKSLEKDFEVAAEEDATQAESPSPDRAPFKNVDD